jgi:hypothetical protein
MSHNALTFNGVEPDARSTISSLLRGVENSTVVTIDYGVSGFAAGVGVARSWRRPAAGNYTEHLLDTGVSVGNSPRRLTGLSTAQYYETITLPAGTWLAEFKIGSTNAANPATTTRLALYNNTTGAIVSNIISYRDANRCPVCVAVVAGNTTYETRVITGALTSIANALAAGVAGWNFKRIA